MKTRRKIALALVAGIGIAGVAMSVLTFRAGSVENAIRYLGGERVFLVPNLVDLGTGPGGKEESAVLHLKNLSGRPIRIVGSQSSCGCMILELPEEVPAHQTHTLKLRIRRQDQAGEIKQGLIVYTADEAVSGHVVHVVGQVHPGTDSKRTQRDS